MSERCKRTSVGVNEQASGPVLQSVFFAVIDHSAILANFTLLHGLINCLMYKFCFHHLQIPKRERGDSLRKLGQNVPKRFNQAGMLGRHDHQRKISQGGTIQHLFDLLSLLFVRVCLSVRPSISHELNNVPIAH